MKLLPGILLFTLVSHILTAQKIWPENLIITPERTNFQKTSTYAEVIQFLQDIEKQSPQVVITSIGKSPEGKDIPLAILSKEKISTPQAAVQSGKLVVYVQGNIHAGEVEGKEVLMMLMRDILLGDKNHLLDNLVILFLPIYNTDSNDKMEKDRRPSQEDSPLEVGIRENSQGLDLNRDGIKHEAHETKALFSSVITTWDPQLFVDLHTTNGTWHAYSLTWAPSYQYAGEPATYDYTNNVMLPAITKAIAAKHDLQFGPYGDYDLDEGWPVKNFYTYNHHPRYLVNQFGLRNRMAILSEAFAHERFYQRIYSTYAFVTEILFYANDHVAEIKSTNKKAEEESIKKVIDGAGKTKKGVRFKMISNEKLNNFITYDYVGSKNAEGKTGWHRSGNIISVDDVNYYGQFEAVKESTMPRGYVIPAEYGFVAEHLKQLGAQVKRLTKSQTFAGEAFSVEKYTLSQRKFEGHNMAKAEGKFSPASRKFKKGDYYVDLAQPLANLIFYVLEPESDDGLVTWNFFDKQLTSASETHPVIYPIFKYYK